VLKCKKPNKCPLVGFSNQLMKEHRMANKDSTLSQNLVAELFSYEDGCLYWNKQKSPSVNLFEKAGSSSEKDRYLRVMINHQSYKVHRLVFLLHHGYMPNYVDHINGDTFDNRIENLRDATYAQNNQNAKIRKDSTSGVKGVFFHKATGKWTASCQVNKKRTHLGLFLTIEEAEKAVKSFREQSHGEFARHS
jgi:HNH endonuclease/AP2 domain